MEEEKKTSKKNRMIVIDGGVVGPRKPVVKKVRQKSLGDYPGLPKAYLDAAKLFSSPRLIGPPICDELMALIQHMFTEEEAEIVRHLKPMQRKTAARIAKKANRPVEEVREILDRLAREKFLILGMGDPAQRLYAVMPIVPGAFEAAMFTTSMDNLNEWQIQFAKLFEQLFETNYMIDYLNREIPGVRYLPVGQTIEAHPMALPSDRLVEIFDRYKTFGVIQCQCGMTEVIAMREALEIKQEAEASGLVSWMINEESGDFMNSSCSCCGCCCHMMRTVTEFNMPSVIAPPHFRPKFDLAACDHCAKCARRCPMGAITVDMKGKTHAYDVKRCVGCGQCVIACDKKHAVQMDAVPDYQKPPASYARLLLKLTPNALRTTWSAWRSRA